MVASSGILPALAKMVKYPSVAVLVGPSLPGQQKPPGGDADLVASVLLTSRILYAVHEFLTRFPVTCSAQTSRRGDQFLHPSGPRRQDRRDLLPAACCDLIPMRFGDFLDQSVGAQERQQTAHLTRLSPVHRRILRPLAVEA